MNPNIRRLAAIASKQERRIIGLMSGTSLDGLDIALCLCQGSGRTTKVSLERFTTVAYTQAFRAEIKSVFSKRQVDLQNICLLNAWITTQHAEMVLEVLKTWNIDPAQVDLIASHGQTIYHAPKHLHQRLGFNNATLQIGDGDHLAFKTGIITISDFRQKHVAAGGEGAPLALSGDYFMFSDENENRILLNIGGIANFTYLSKDRDPQKVFSTDVGPGNTLMDQFVQHQFPGSYFDQNGELASRGKVNDLLLKELSNHPFFQGAIPKTTGPELFNLSFLEQARHNSGTLNLAPEDVLATLCKFTANTIIQTISTCFPNTEDLHIYASGGGIHNPVLMSFLKLGLPHITFRTTAELGIHPDAKEAVLFAALANETVAGGDVEFGNSNQVPSVCMGKISFPT